MVPTENSFKPSRTNSFRIRLAWPERDDERRIRNFCCSRGGPERGETGGVVA